jgi:ribosomal-protein-serine acetyltransferase
MTQACQALIEIGFQQLGLTTITISCARENHKSQRMPLRLGFVWQQMLPNKEWLYDHYVDHDRFFLRRPKALL